MTTLSRPKPTLDHERLDAVVRPVVAAHGAEVVDIEWKSEPKGWVLRVYVEKLGSDHAGAAPLDAAVGLDLCSAVAKDLSPALDVADLIPHRYHLEVSSPGVERRLRGPADYARFAGHKARVRLSEPGGGPKVLTGVLEAAPSPTAVALRDGASLHVVPVDRIATAHLVFEFGPAPRPGKGKKPGKHDPRPAPKHSGETSNS